MERHNAAQFTVSRSEVHSSSMAQRGACFCRALGRTTEVTNCVYQWGVRESRHKGSDEAELQQRRGGGGNTLGFALLKARREEKKWPVPEPRGAPVPTLSDRCGWHLRGTTTTESPPPTTVLPCPLATSDWLSADLPQDRYLWNRIMRHGQTWHRGGGICTVPWWTWHLWVCNSDLDGALSTRNGHGDFSQLLFLAVFVNILRFWEHD